MLTEYVEPAVKELFPGAAFKRVVWQDDGASIHRTDHALDTVKNFFTKRISTKVQAAKMDDLWPSEVPWAIIDEKLRQKKGAIKIKLGLKREITKIWRGITPEQCRKLIEAVPVRLKAIIQKEGGRLLGKRTEGA